MYPTGTAVLRQVQSLLSCNAQVDQSLEIEALTPDRCYSIDILLHMHGKPLAIEVDGPHHFTQTQPYKVLGPTALRTRLLEAQGFHVVSVPYFEWEAIASEDGRMQYLQQKLDTAAGNKAWQPSRRLSSSRNRINS